MKPLPLSTLTALLVASLLLAACDKKESAPAAGSTGGATKAAAKPSDPMLVELSPEMTKAFRVEPAAMSDIAVEQKVSGRIEANERMTMRIGSSVTGRVMQVFAEVGDRVKAGQSLATLSSPELTNAQLAFLRALSMSSLAERAVERAKALVAADVIGTAELQRREVELSVARAELRAAHDQLRLIGLREETIEKLRATGAIASEVNIRATRSGIVIERKVSQGQVAQPGDPLFTVADLSNVWVIGALPEQDANSVQLNQKVDVQVSALGAQKLTGRIVFVSDTVQPDTRTVPIRTEVNNPKFELKPQMLATLTLSGQHVKQLAIPATAVVRENDKDYVFVRLAENKFRLTEVMLDPAAGELRPVRKGLDEGTPIVVDGSFHLNSQRKRAELE
ncbi:MAG: efflux RND transporter periplasmic adaptor subunit [Betaproteobacteria bacterium]|nr:efflux RND transporter periplasmic adaptor subunit [Betaproteobacteria bacterium]